MLSFLLVASRSTWACELKCKPDIFEKTYERHAPRERVSWNRHLDVWRNVGRPVTLHVSVWVEIGKYDSFCSFAQSRSTWACELKLCKQLDMTVESCSHAPRERVSWNMTQFANSALQGGHAPRERVSWNLHKLMYRLFLPLSRSTWACELK